VVVTTGNLHQKAFSQDDVKKACLDTKSALMRQQVVVIQRGHKDDRIENYIRIN
jgi:hypothetical protein